MGTGKSPTIAAVFDLDGTLYTGHITLGISQHHRMHHVKRLQLLSYMAVHLPIWGLQVLGLMSQATSRQIWARNLGWTVRGWTKEEAEKVFKWIAEQYVEPMFRGEVIERLHDHQKAGHRVILVSGTPSPLLAEIGQRLGVDEIVGTPLILNNGRYSGASEAPVCQGPNKVTRLESYLRETNDIIWSESYAYADSHVDIPLLESFGIPVAVHPDSQLASHARESGWEILQ